MVLLEISKTEQEPHGKAEALNQHLRGEKVALKHKIPPILNKKCHLLKNAALPK